MPTVLVVDDDADIRTLVRLTLESAAVSFEIVGEADDGAAALRCWRELDPPPVPHIIVLDNFMPDRTGLEVAAEIMAEYPGQPIVLFSAFLDKEITAAARELGLTCLDKARVHELPDLLTELMAATED